MGPAETDRTERGAWTPFVGVALAALTAGSLLLFSFIAQRTSLEGFSTRGVTAISPSLASPRSITLPEPSDESDEAVAGPSSEATTTDTALSTLSPTLDASDDFAPTTTTPTVDVADEGTAAAPAPTAAGNADGDDGRESDRDDDGTFSASFAGDADREIFFRGGEGRAAAQEWQAPDDEDADRSAKGRSKGKGHKSKERGKASGRNGGGHNCSASAQRAKHNRGASARPGSRRGCSARANRRHGGSDKRGDSDERHGRGRSHQSAKPRGSAEHRRPTYSSPPAPRPQAQRASHGNGKGSPPAHSNAGGKGSHGRGRGHGRN